MAASREHLITRAEAARLLGVSRAAITKACHPGGRLRRARRGKSIDARAAELDRWIEEREARAEQLGTRSTRRAAIVRPRRRLNSDGSRQA